MAKFELENNPLFEQIQEKPKRGRPKKDDIVRGNSVQEGLTKEFTRATFIMQVDILEKLKNYAYTERIAIKDAVNNLLDNALNKEEQRLKKEGRQILERGEND